MLPYRENGYRKKEDDMPKRIAPLVDTRLRTAKSKNKPYKLTDGNGLYLLVTPTGGKLWRLDYSFSDKRKTLSLGSYPEISLTDARQRRDAARKLLANGADPSEVKQQQKYQEQEQKERESLTFRRVAEEWLGKNEPVWSDSHIKTVRNRLEHDVFPVIGDKPIASIERAKIKNIMMAVAGRGAIETADRIKQYCGQIFRYAINLEYVESNPASDLRDILPKREAGHHAAVIELDQLAGLLRAIDEYGGSLVVKKALQLAPLFFVRPGELSKAEWSQINFETAEWRYFITKTKVPHIVPLATQAVSILRELYAVTGTGRYVFPSYRTASRPMTSEALLAALRRMGYSSDEMTTHGFRAIARTHLDETLGYRVDWIEAQSAHAVKDANGRAYNRTTYLDDRKKMMQAWADYLDDLKAGAKVIPLRQASSEAA
jgi:integrase